jgi:NADPH-dependent glutamate synthase beta subunit-like oxidoreductase
VRAIAEGRIEDAYLIARGPNPLASICGRVCGARCEAACRRKDIDEAVSIRALKRFVTDRFGGHADESSCSPESLIQRIIQHTRRRDTFRSGEFSGFAQFLSGQELPRNTDGEKVAIVGSGPAGLSAAHDLALLGFRPTVYEMEPVPAGMLAVGIPEYRLPRVLIKAEVEFIEALGVEFICNTKVGEDISLAEIRSQHRATIIAVGLKQSRTLPIPGADGKGIFGGVEFLRDVALGRKIDLKGNVAVIGGGNVAFDIARTAVRRAYVDISRTALRRPEVESVFLCSLESLDELPADDLEIIESDEEGIVRHHGVGPQEILLDASGQVKGVVFQRCTRVFDEQGRFAPEFDESDVTTVPADTVLWGIGQRPDLSFAEAEGDIERDDRGLIRCDEDMLQTSAEDVFLSGDVAYGPRLLIDAVASGKKVARNVYQYIRGKKLVEQIELVHVDLLDYRREPDYEKLRRRPVPTLGPLERKRSQKTAVEIGYDQPQAVREGCRCLDCGVNTIFDSEKCILCGGCADVCPELCLKLVSLDGDKELQQALAGRMGDEDPSQWSAIIKDETRCIRCALCFERCPSGAITMERATFKEVWVEDHVSTGSLSDTG